MAAGPLPMGDVRAIGRQLASALAAAHAQGVVHRDLKPANIHVTRDGSIKVLDFGVAKLVPPIAYDNRRDDRRPWPNDGTAAATRGRRSPCPRSSCSAGPIDARTDIYSAGVILFMMATGQRRIRTPAPSRWRSR